MPKKKKDTSAHILEHLESIERSLLWLSKKTEIPYGTLYGIFYQKTMKLTPEKLELINKALETEFSLP